LFGRADEVTGQRAVQSDRGTGMFRKILGGALVAIVVAIGLVALAIPYYWAYWIWHLDWGTFLMNRRWILGFVGFTFGTFVLLVCVAVGTASLAMAAWYWVDDR
jgi:hypothetical protein